MDENKPTPRYVRWLYISIVLFFIIIVAIVVSRRHQDAQPDIGPLTSSAQQSAPLAELQQIRSVPLAVINTQLINLQRAVPQLILASAPNIVSSDVIASPPVKQNGWLTRGWNRLKDLITVRKTDTPLIALLSQDMKVLASQHLLSLLIQTQAAAQLAQPEIYQENLQQIIWLVEHYYQLDDSKTQEFLTALVTLQKIDIAPAVSVQESK